MKPFKLSLNENIVRLKDIADIKTNFPEADFWLTSKGSDKTVGTPVREFNKEHIGVKVIATDVIDANYLFYMMMHFQMKGTFKALSKGTLKLVNITAKDVQDIKLGS